MRKNKIHLKNGTDTVCGINISNNISIAKLLKTTTCKKCMKTWRRDYGAGDFQEEVEGFKEKKNRIHLAGIGDTLCGIDMFKDSFTSIAKLFKKVTCNRCMKTETYKQYLAGSFKEKP